MFMLPTGLATASNLDLLAIANFRLMHLQHGMIDDKRKMDGCEKEKITVELAARDISDNQDVTTRVQEAFYFDDRVGQIMCVEHLIAVNNVNALRSHCRSKHKFTLDGIPTKRVAAILLSRCTPYHGNHDFTSNTVGQPNETPVSLGGSLRKKSHDQFRNAPEGNVVLEAHDGLILKAGFKCPRCVYFHVETVTLFQHLQKSHDVPSEDARKISCNLNRVPVQSLLNGRKGVKYFPVFLREDSKMYNIWKSIEPDLPQQSLEPQTSGNGSSNFLDAVTAELQHFLSNENSSKNILQTAATASLDSHDEKRSKSFFLKLMHFDETLLEAGFEKVSNAPTFLVFSPSELRRSNFSDVAVIDYDVECTVKKDIESYMMTAKDHYQHASYPVRRAISIESGCHSEKIFRPLTTRESVRRYADEVSRLLLFVLRNYCATSSHDHITATSSSECGENIPIEWRDGHMVLPRELYRVCTAYMNFLRERFSKENHSEIQRKGDGEPCAKRKKIGSNVLESDSIEGAKTTAFIYVHHVLRLLLLVSFQETNSLRPLIVRQFFALHSLKCDPRKSQQKFKNAEEMTHTYASLLYISSCCALIELSSTEIPWLSSIPPSLSQPMEIATAASTPQFELTEEGISRGVSSGDPVSLSIKDVKALVSIDANTAVSYLRESLNKCMAVIKSNPSTINFINCSLHERCGVVQGKEVSLDDLSSFVNLKIRSIEEAIERDILLGLGLPDGFENKMKNIIDDFSQPANGFWFMEKLEDRQWSSELQSRVIKHIWRNDVLRNLWFKQSQQNVTENHKHVALFSRIEETGDKKDDRDVYVRVETAERWLSECVKLQGDLLCIAHLLGGGPARGTEIATYQLRNSLDSPRNIFNVQGELFIKSFYNKTDNLKGTQTPIIRVLSREISKYFFLYYVMVRPFESFIVSKLQGKERGIAHATYAFVENGIPFSSSRITTTFQRELSFTGIPLSFVEYRHYQCAMARRYLSNSGTRQLFSAGAYAEGLSSEPGNLLPIHSQAGHTSETADRIYGVTGLKNNGITYEKMAYFREAALRWSDLIHPRKAREEGEASHFQSLISSTPNTAEIIESVRRSLHSVVRKELPKALESIMNAQSERQANIPRYPMRTSTAQENDIHRTNNSNTPAYSSGKNVSLREIRNVLQTLRSMLEDENATFKSKEQMKAILCASKGEEDTLIVMPTGSGKSMVYMLPAFASGGSSLIIVVVPLVALIQDLIRRCKELGICAGTWEDRKSFQLDILFVSVEYVGVHEYETLVGEWANTGRLKTIVVDEAHVTGIWKTFRDSMRDLKYTLRPASSPVQLILLTATIPPNLEKKLCDLHGMKQYQVIRAPVDGRHISYNVKIHEVEKFLSAENSLINEVFRGVRAEAELIEARQVSLEEKFGSQILVYCPTRIMVERLAEKISNSNTSNELVTYHAGMSEKDRKRSFNQWVSFSKRKASLPDIQIMVATCAFGLGVDSDLVCCVVHAGGCEGLLQYVQETGRCGRNGKAARCLLIFCQKTIEKIYRKSAGNTEAQFDNGSRSILDPREEEKKFAEWALMKDYCRKQALFTALDGHSDEVCWLHQSDHFAWCDNCVEAYKCSTRAQNEHSRQGNAGCCTTPKATKSQVCSELGNMVGTSTTKVNHQDVKLLRIEVRRRREDFRLKCIKLLNTCIACIIERNVWHDKKDSCYCSKRTGCYRCLIHGHGASQCPTLSTKALEMEIGVARNISVYCFACGLSNVCGIPIHEAGEFGSRQRCPLLAALQLSLGYLVRKCYLKDEKASEELTKLHAPFPGSQKSASEIQKDYYKWLIAPDIIQTGINVMGVMDIITNLSTRERIVSEPTY